MERYDLEDTNKYGYEPHMSMVESIDGDYIPFTDHEEAIKQAVAAEREACAKIAESEKYPEKYCTHSRNMMEEGNNSACDDIADAIRQRGEK